MPLHVLWSSSKRGGDEKAEERHGWEISYLLNFQRACREMRIAIIEASQSLQVSIGEKFGAPTELPTCCEQREKNLACTGRRKKNVGSRAGFKVRSGGRDELKAQFSRETNRTNKIDLDRIRKSVLKIEGFFFCSSSRFFLVQRIEMLISYTQVN